MELARLTEFLSYEFPLHRDLPSSYPSSTTSTAIEVSTMTSREHNGPTIKNLYRVFRQQVGYMVGVLPNNSKANMQMYLIRLPSQI